MRRVDQTVMDSEKGNCFSACVASIIETTIADVPFFMDPGEWYDRFSKWLKGRGFYPLCFDFDGWEKSEVKRFRSELGPHILSGKSPRGEHQHSVVASGLEVVHDPHPSRDGIETFLDVIIIVRGTL